MIFAFVEPPPFGTLVMLDEQTYELADMEPYTRTNGTQSAILRWETACPACGASFNVKTGLSARELTRRCEDHRRMAKPVKGKRGRKLKVQIILP